MGLEACTCGDRQLSLCLYGHITLCSLLNVTLAESTEKESAVSVFRMNGNMQVKGTIV